MDEVWVFSWLLYAVPYRLLVLLLKSLGASWVLLKDWLLIKIISSVFRVSGHFCFPLLLSKAIYISSPNYLDWPLGVFPHRLFAITECLKRAYAIQGSRCSWDYLNCFVFFKSKFSNWPLALRWHFWPEQARSLGLCCDFFLIFSSFKALPFVLEEFSLINSFNFMSSSWSRYRPLHYHGVASFIPILRVR